MYTVFIQPLTNRGNQQFLTAGLSLNSEKIIKSIIQHIDVDLSVR